MANTRRTTKVQDDATNSVVESVPIGVTEWVQVPSSVGICDNYVSSIWKDIDSNTKYLSIPGGIVLNYNGSIEYINGIRYNEESQKFERI